MTNQEFKLKKMTLAVKAMFGFAAIVAAFGFLIQSTSPAHADAPTATNEAGRYMMTMASTMDETDNVRIWYILAWDTSSGKSKLYSGNSNINRTQGASSEYNLPSYPL